MEIYISTDVETDGPIPGPNSMLSLGAAAFTKSEMIGQPFSVNLSPLPEAKPDLETEKWWKSQPKEIYDACRTNPISPEIVFVGYPAGFDFLFVYWYLLRFTGDSPFSFSALDIKTLAF